MKLIGLSSLGNAVYSGTGISALYGIEEQPVLLPNAKRSYGALRGRIVDGHFAILEKYAKLFLLVDTIVETLSCFALGKAVKVLQEQR